MFKDQSEQLMLHKAVPSLSEQRVHPGWFMLHVRKDGSQ